MITKHKEGFGNFDLLIVLLIVSLFVYSLIYIPFKKQSIINETRNTHLPTTAEQINLVASFKLKPSPDFEPEPEYLTSGEIHGMKFTEKLIFHYDETLTKETILLEEYKLSGNARYRFEGSVMMYSEIIGDKVVFSEIGSPIIFSDRSLVIYNAGFEFIYKTPSLIEEELTASITAENKRITALNNKSFGELNAYEFIERYLSSKSQITLIIAVPVLLLILSVIFSLYSRLRRGS